MKISEEVKEDLHHGMEYCRKISVSTQLIPIL